MGIHKIITIIFISIFLVLFSACNKEITAIGFDPAELPMLNRKGQTFQVKAYAVSEKGIYAGPLPKPIWMSSDESVVSVNDGLITAVGSGNAKIIVSQGTVQKEIPISVSILQKVTLNQTGELIIKRGESLQLSAIAYDDKNKPITQSEFKWSSADNDIAKVDQTGKVEALEFGQTQIKAVFVDKMAVVTLKVEGQGSNPLALPDSTSKNSEQNTEPTHQE